MPNKKFYIGRRLDGEIEVGSNTKFDSNMGFNADLGWVTNLCERQFNEATGRTLKKGALYQCEMKFKQVKKGENPYPEAEED